MDNVELPEPRPPVIRFAERYGSIANSEAEGVLIFVDEKARTRAVTEEIAERSLQLADELMSWQNYYKLQVGRVSMAGHLDSMKPGQKHFIACAGLLASPDVACLHVVMHRVFELVNFYRMNSFAMESPWLDEARFETLASKFICQYSRRSLSVEFWRTIRTDSHPPTVAKDIDMVGSYDSVILGYPWKQLPSEVN